MADASLDSTIAELYASAFVVPLNEFRRVALAEIRKHIPFSSAVWATFRRGRAKGKDDSSAVIHSLTLVDQNPAVPRLLAEKYTEEDPFRVHCRREPGRTFRIEDTMTIAAYRKTALYREMARHYGIEHGMGTIIRDRAVNVMDFLALWRDDRSQPFSDGERQLKEQLTMHAVNGWRHRQSLSLGQTPDFFDLEQSAPVMAHGRALADAHGVVCVADGSFTRLMQHAFPEWRGPDLPPRLIALIATGETHVALSGLEINLVHDGAYVCIAITAADPESPLSEAEMAVAELFVKGLSTSEIASSRGVSASTVRNQVASIYRKLEVHSKVDLARLIGHGAAM